MKSYKVIIFDFVDMLASGANISALTRELERELGREVVDAMIGEGRIDLDKSADDIVNQAKAIKAVTPTQEALIRQWIFPGSITLFPEVKETFEYLKGKGHKIGVIMNTPPIERDELITLGLDQYIDCVVRSFECGYRKPDKRIFDLFLAKASAKRDEALMIGNHLKEDILGAQSAGIDAILLDKEGKESFQPKIQSLLELKNIL